MEDCNLVAWSDESGFSLFQAVGRVIASQMVELLRREDSMRLWNQPACKVQCSMMAVLCNSVGFVLLESVRITSETSVCFNIDRSFCKRFIFTIIICFIEASRPCKRHDTDFTKFPAATHKKDNPEMYLDRYTNSRTATPRRLHFISWSYDLS